MPNKLSRLPATATGALFLVVSGSLTTNFTQQAKAFEACQPPSPSFASPRSNQSTNISISADKNIGQHSFTVVIYWIDFNGNLQKYRVLKPGQQYLQPTKTGHIWVARDGHNQCQYYTVKAGNWNFFHVKY